MLPLRRPLGAQTRNNPFVRSLIYALFAAPVAAMAIAGSQAQHRPADFHNGAAYSASAKAAMVNNVKPPSARPEQTIAILRPSRKANDTPMALTSEADPQALILAAFRPDVDASFAPASRASQKPTDMPTASMPPQHIAAARAIANLEGRRWQMQTLRAVGVAEGLRLISGGAMLTLAGVEPLTQGASCKRLDGVMEPCSVRALARLEVLTRGRTIFCRVYEAAPGEARIANCKADKIDLADDLIRNGLARRADA